MAAPVANAFSQKSSTGNVRTHTTFGSRKKSEAGDYPAFESSLDTIFRVVHLRSGGESRASLASSSACRLLLLGGSVLTGATKYPAGASIPHIQHASRKSPGTGRYAETDICKTCHQDVWEKHFAGTPHSALLKGDQHGCQGRHGPAQAHVDGGGDPTKIIRFEKLTPAQTAAICLNCHQA